MEAAGRSDSCLTQDEESSCDTTGSQPNSHHPHVSSTEEESSNEPPAEPPDTSGAREEPTPKEGEPPDDKECANNEKQTELHCHGENLQPDADEDSPTKQTDLQPSIERSQSSEAEVHLKHTEGLPVSQVDCVNGNESMDSLDSHSLKRSSDTEKRTPQSSTEGSAKPEEEEHKDKNESEPTQEQPPQDGRTVTESVEEDQDGEGIKLVSLTVFIPRMYIHKPIWNVFSFPHL